MTYYKKIVKKGGTSLVEMEGHRVNGKTVQKYIRYVGTIYRPDPNISSKTDISSIFIFSILIFDE